ncbi:N-acetylglucosamine-6-phosphate deacetylase [Bacillus pinisoli]|uniref:N-acetylglucosamine-6-phosphate deacetylase n=1 Tax=Bacillus pinisoli TaxID=2901866 RepID=UPI001FF55049|nr:N-acetylglucosamine-6-phosphate deacetylase [Bacillus pinisoli]
MKQFIINGIKINQSSGRVLEDGYIKVKNEKIIEVGTSNTLTDTQGFTTLSIPNNLILIPGMIDIHIHGTGGVDVMDGHKEALETMATYLPKEGTTSFLATTMTEKVEDIKNSLHHLADYINTQATSGMAEMLGIHLEGPFISTMRSGAQSKTHIIPPTIPLFEELQRAAKGTIKITTLAPEVDGGNNLIQYLKKAQVITSIGHSDATYNQVLQAVQDGATHITHMYNGMRGLHHREPGVVGAALLNDKLTLEIIADGIHSHPEMVRMAYLMKPKDKLILITDSISAKCLHPGTYKLGKQEVIVDEKTATLGDGTIAGSLLKMNEAARNFLGFTNCSLEEIIQFTSENPAKHLNIFDRKGSIDEGKDADFVLINSNFEVFMTCCRGKIAYQTEQY